jgi:REP element-mobilizing transposase RayT
MDGIGRKRLPHDPPSGIGTGGELFFITICSAQRDSKPLVQRGIPEILVDAVSHRNKTGTWFTRLFLVMPDHVHALIRIPIGGSLRRPISDWKRWTATKGGFEWQRDFFDHRLRGAESEREKVDYILQNPVRAGLVEKVEDWPWVWMPE